MLDIWMRYWKSFQRMNGNYDQQLDGLLQDALKAQYYDHTTLQLIKRAAALRDLRVMDVMTPKAQVTFLKSQDSLEHNLAIMREHEHSRYPVIDDHQTLPRGVLLAKDLLAEDFFDKTVQQNGWLKLIRPPVFVPFSRRLHDLLNDFRRHRNHMLIVTDEHGLCIGIITIEDVLEQIVGSIEDEYDEVIDMVQSHSDALSYTIAAEYDLNDFAERFSYELSENDKCFDTLGGYLTSLFGYLPKEGDTIIEQSIQFTVSKAEPRKILMIHIRDLRDKDL